MCMKRRFLFASLIASILVVPVARSADRPFLIEVYGQAGFADQSLADQRIDRINEHWGTDFETWNDPTVQYLGARLLKEVSPRWMIGLQAEYGRAPMSRSALAIPPFEPPTEHKFVLKQESDLADLMVVGRRSLCSSCRRLDPFVHVGAGVGYATGSTHFEANPTVPHLFYNYLRLESDGWFPVATVALGVSTPLNDGGRWFLELGTGYQWGRLSHDVRVEGPLRFPGEPGGEQVSTETNATGASFWLGLGARF